MPKTDGRDALPEGVLLRPLTVHADPRGTLIEIFRQSWNETYGALQWTVTQNHARAMRGMHVHARHTDYLVVIAGTVLLGLHDLRDTGAQATCMLTLEATAPQAVLIPPGVCHGFYSAAPGTILVGTSEYWDVRDDLGCRFDAPELGLNWPDPSPALSARDRDAMPYAEMRTQYFRTDLNQRKVAHGISDPKEAA